MTLPHVRISLALPKWPAHTPADLLSELSGTNLIIDGALTEAARREQRKVRCRVTRRLAPATVHTVSVAGSLIASRSQFAHAAYKTPHFEIFEWFFRNASSGINLFLTGSRSRESLQIRRWAKMPQTAPPNFANFFDGTVFAGAWTSGLVALGKPYGASKSSARLFVLIDGLV